MTSRFKTASTLHRRRSTTSMTSKSTSTPQLFTIAALPAALLLLLGTSQLAEAYRDEFIPLKEYMKFPKLFDYDDFEDCRRNNLDDYAYCIVHARIVPDETSALWKNLSDFSKDFSHYDHTLLERGICIQDCEKSLRLREQFESDEPHSYSLYAKNARTCINIQFKRQYHLEIEPRVKIYYCYTNDNENPPMDYLECFFYLIIMLLIALTVCCTIYDVRESIRLGCPDKYFVRSPKAKSERLMVSFSFPRNWCRLTNTQDGRTRQDLQFLEAFRVIMMARVVLLHVTLAHTKVPTSSPEYMEQMQNNPIIIFFVAEFQNYVQTFLSISGMLLTVNFLEHMRKNPDFKFGVFWEKLRNRLSRIVPAYAFIILVECAIFHRYKSAPIGQQYIGEAQENCRRYWWTNLLFFNNYIRTDEPCMIQSWYLAADMQLFIFGLLVMMCIWKWPWTKTYIFVAAFASAAMVPTITTYVKDIEPAMTVKMKNFNHYTREHDYQYDIYFPFHQNIGVYCFGMLAGFIYHQYRDSTGTILKSKLFRIAFFFATILFVLCMSSVYHVLYYRDQILPILQAIYSTLFKHSWAILTTFLQLTLALMSSGHWLKKCFSHSFFDVAGKLSFGIYLIHFSVIELVYGGLKAPYYSTERTISMMGGQVFFWTLFYGTMLTTLVELPSAAALKELLDRRKSKVHDIRETTLGPVGNNGVHQQPRTTMAE